MIDFSLVELINPFTFIVGGFIFGYYFMQYLILFFAFLFNCLSCFISYRKDFHILWWYIPLGVLLGGICSYLWFIGVRIISSSSSFDESEIYCFSMIYDFTLVLVYYFLPILVFGIKFDRFGLVGILMMFSGLILIKFSSFGK